MALIELPRLCDHWRDPGMASLIDGTLNRVHEFDGCMYGLRSSFTKNGNLIKEPWKIVSWVVKFKGLHRRCDGPHELDRCEGKYAVQTQLYTILIIGHIYLSTTSRLTRNKFDRIENVDAGIMPKQCE